MTQDEYATLIFYWHHDPHPERLDEILTALQNQGWASSPGRELPMAGAVLAFETLYPDLKATWRSAFKRLYTAVIKATWTDKDQSEWNDFHVAQWFILRDPNCIDKLLDRVKSDRAAGRHARRAIGNWSVQCAPFRVAVKRAQALRAEGMIVKVDG